MIVQYTFHFTSKVFTRADLIGVNDCPDLVGLVVFAFIFAGLYFLQAFLMVRKTLSIKQPIHTP